nr:peptidyl-prolyl cis-trans isomerase [Lachnospira sp.]
ASDSEVSAYYEDNKDTYDKFEYRMFKVKAESSDSSDMANAKETANSFASGVSSELDFINQCRKFAEAGDDTYADDAASLVTETKKSNIEEACADWIASSDRKEGDLTVIEDDDNTCFYIVYYISRSYDGSDDDAIKSTLLNQKYSEYIKKYTDEYSVNVKKRFSYK